MPTKRTPSGARVRRRPKALPSPRLVPLMRLVTALTDATNDDRITWDVEQEDATWQGTDGHVTLAWALTPKGAVKSAVLTVEERSVNIWIDVAMFDNVRVLTPLVRALIARHQEFVAKIVDGLLADIAGPVEAVTESRVDVVAVTGEATPDVAYITPHTTPAVIRETPGIRAAIRRWFWRA